MNVPTCAPASHYILSPYFITFSQTYGAIKLRAINELPYKLQDTGEWMENNLKLKTLILSAQAGDLDAFETIVLHFQDLAVGYAYSILGDFHLAKDAAQEAFISAYCELKTLREPKAFPFWFRKLVFKHCDRIRRRHHLETVSLEEAMYMPSNEKSQLEKVEEQELRESVLNAGYSKTAQLLISHGADVNAKDNDDATPLHHAVKGGHLECIELLLSHGAEVKVKDKQGKTPLHWAQEAKQEAVVDLLRRHGATE